MTISEDQWDRWISEHPAFYELFFGCWASWFVLLFLWTNIVRKVESKDQYLRLVLMHIMGSSFYLVNHYLGNAPLGKQILWGYAAVFFVIFFLTMFVLAPPNDSLHTKSPVAALGVISVSVVYTFAYIAFEQLARVLHEKAGIPELFIQMLNFAAVASLVLFLLRQERKRMNSILSQQPLM
eukprot:c7067_g1_i1.p1 GENE.c7067_g1_i1~~c7067_g1_i1.p1  ORF type:complete len:199 (+),score=38.14 c7067_g1_i1:57-599(+)